VPVKGSGIAPVLLMGNIISMKTQKMTENYLFLGIAGLGFSLCLEILYSCPQYLGQNVVSGGKDKQEIYYWLHSLDLFLVAIHKSYNWHTQRLFCPSSVE